MKLGRLLPLILFFTISLATLKAQPYFNGPWEYERYPDLPFLLEEIDMELTVDPSVPLIKGTADYLIRSRRPDLTQVIFNTSDLDVRGISFGGDEADYRISGDSLLINLPDTLDLTEEISFQIEWESSSPYGIHSDGYGNVWTSLNPQMQNHWLPIPDHPEVESVVKAAFIIPADKEVVFNGEKTEDEVISTEQRKVSWLVEEPIAVTGLTIAVGNFVHESARAGAKSVSLWTPENSLLGEVRSRLLESAVESLKKYESDLEFEFPYEPLQIVVLPDHRWEEVQAGAGVIYLYQNLGSLATQLRRGIAAQWIGNYHRYIQPVDGRYEFLKALVAGSPQTEQLNKGANLESIAYWNRSEKAVESVKNEFQKNIIQSSLPELMHRFEGVTGWDEYADIWYNETGVFWHDVALAEQEEEVSEEGSSVYNVEYLYDEMAGSLTLVFEADTEPVRSLVSLQAVEYGFTDTTRSEISFTGERDSVQVEISSGIEYLTLDVTSEQNITLQEEKPFIFLIRQLRNSDSEVQIQAANQLSSYSENPDVQLAIQDVMSNEVNAEVRAALLETLAALTNGATGTEETFLQSINAENRAIQLSSIRSLANYPGNDRVKNAIRNTLLRSEEDTVFTTALDTYQQLSDAGEMRAIAERFSSNDQHQRSLDALTYAVAEDSTRESLTIADRYALGSYPYEVRLQALELLIKHEENEAYWEQTLEMLLEDRDPRIRFQALNAVKHLSSKTTVELIRARLNEEMDPRVRAKIRRML
ncbi:HEAT repeat domain-containing protein [Rhodohalobacter sp.]|uniref:HEAT repeat domain-containing protein n=1 Tax=Rhodohalobacter sp. TaxID=1974210 RepID=UPI002ACD2317|nr:HEAT repeat domain-containing protein [Rhodohalobacter sp.]MDZ7756210.1 hypothetical protein [Rhodohalobacter sp.]